MIKDGTSVRRQSREPPTERGLGAWPPFRREKVPGTAPPGSAPIAWSMIWDSNHA